MNVNHRTTGGTAVMVKHEKAITWAVITLLCLLVWALVVVWAINVGTALFGNDSRQTTPAPSTVVLTTEAGDAFLTTVQIAPEDLERTP